MTSEAEVREMSTVPTRPSPAQRRQLRLRGLWANYTEAQDKLLALLHEAQENDDYKALGYPSWTAYIADTFGAEPALRLAREKRQELVHLLSDEGMGTRAIGQALHISKNTVTADLRQQEVSQSGTPEPDRTREELAAACLVQPAAEGVVTVVEHTVPAPITEMKKATTGLDGKAYTRPEAPATAPRRRPLPGAYRDALYDLRKVLERIDRLTLDDRFLANRENLAEVYSSDMGRALAALALSSARLRLVEVADVVDEVGDHAPLYFRGERQSKQYDDESDEEFADRRRLEDAEFAKWLFGQSLHHPDVAAEQRPTGGGM